MALPVITLKHLKHRGGKHIGLYFNYNEALIAHTKKIDGIKWSATNKCWYIENKPRNLRCIFSRFKDIAKIDKANFITKENPVETNVNKIVRKVKPDVKKVPKRYINLLIRRRYSKNTINVYTHFFSEFINHLNKTSNKIVNELKL